MQNHNWKLMQKGSAESIAFAMNALKTCEPCSCIRLTEIRINKQHITPNTKGDKTMILFRAFWVVLILSVCLIAVMSIFAIRANGQVLEKGLSPFKAECRMYGGLSINQRTEQGQYGKNGLAGAGWFAGTMLSLRSGSVDGGPAVVLSYSQYNAETRLLQHDMKLLRAEIGAFADWPIQTHRVGVIGSFGKAWIIKYDNGIGGSLSAFYESVNRFGVVCRWSYYDFGQNTLALIEAGIHLWLF